jgi:hypothetical protein
VCSLNLSRETNSNSISNLSSKLISLICKMTSLCFGPLSSFPCSAAAQPVPSFSPTNPRRFSLSQSPTRGPRLAVSVSPTSLPFLPFPLDSGAGQPSRPKRAAGLATPARGTGRGRTARPARTPRPGARARDWVRPRGKVKDEFAPPCGHPRRSKPRPRRATCPARRAARGLEGFSPRAAAATIQKERAGGHGGRASLPPSWGFHFHRTAVSTGLREKAGAPPPRHAVGKRSGHAAAATRHSRKEPRTGRKDYFSAKERRAAPEGGSRAASAGRRPSAGWGAGG